MADSAWLESWTERLTAVTADDVQRVAQRYFTRNNRTVGWFVPEPEGDA